MVQKSIVEGGGGKLLTGDGNYTWRSGTHMMVHTHPLNPHALSCSLATSNSPLVALQSVTRPVIS